MKTIFIPIFQGVEARNILRTDIFNVLKNQKNLRIILFVPSEEKKQYFKKEFPGDNIIFEVFNNYKKSSFYRLFTFFKFILINTGTLDELRKIKLSKDKNYILYYLKFIFNRIFSCKFFRNIIRWLDWVLVKDNNYIEYFKKYKPDLIFPAHLFGDEELSMLRQAKKLKVKSIGLINSWDKLTSRCMIRLLPDKMIVHNEIMKQDAINFADMKASNIEVVGIPHYDIFVNQKPTLKKDFFKQAGININKRLVLICPLGKYYSDVDVEMINIISDFQAKKIISEDLQIMVRFPPNDIVDRENIKNKDKLIFIEPGTRFSLGASRRVDWDMNNKDIQFLLDSLFYMSLMISHVSTLSIDAAVFNKPVINYCLPPEGKISYFRDPRWTYKLTHYQSIINSKGIRIAKSKEELLDLINNYLENPSLDSENRKKIVKEQCWKLDGKAGERTANFILDYLKLHY